MEFRDRLFWILHIVLIKLVHDVGGVDVELYNLPEDVADLRLGYFRLDYHPAVGFPPPNVTFPASELAAGGRLVVGDVIPGTEYAFQLYHGTALRRETLVWSTFAMSEPEPPSNLTYVIRTGKVVDLEWEPPAVGGYSAFKLSVVPLSPLDETDPRDIYLGDTTLAYTLSDLTPGAPYQVLVSSLFNQKESAGFVSVNFTTKPNAPGRFIVWFRNETTLLVLWQPPFPSGIFEQYRLSISPPDAFQPVRYVAREEGSPGPAQVAFNGLTPGRAYNISVQTVSRNQVSDPTEAQYLTVPYPPSGVTFDRQTVTPYSVEIRWSPPSQYSEFDRYQVSLGRSPERHTIARDSERVARFQRGLLPGRTYAVAVKTLSGSVASANATGNATTRPLPVLNLRTVAREPDLVMAQWDTHPESLQDSYMVKYHEGEVYTSDDMIQLTMDQSMQLSHLLPGRNYTISVSAVSNDVPSEPALTFLLTKPSSPVIEIMEPLRYGWNVSWKSDVTSRQERYLVTYVRNDTGHRDERDTQKTWMLLNDLYPGATYRIGVVAVSHGLRSDPHSYLKTVYPKPPEHLQVSKATNTSLLVTWIAPAFSLVGHYNIRYKPVTTSQAPWQEIGGINSTSTELHGLTPGERYVVQVFSVSHGLPSPELVEVEQTMYPNKVRQVRHILDAHNVTFEWLVPPGKVDFFIVMYTAGKESSSQPPEQKEQVIHNDQSPGKPTSVIIHELKPGEMYTFRIYSVSHNLRSEAYTVQTRTMPVIDSVINIVTGESQSRTLLIKYTPTPRRSAVFDRYRFQLSGTAIPAQEKLATDVTREVIFDGLIPGRLYNLTIWTISGGLYSIPIYRQARLYPEKVENVRTLGITDSQINLEWTPPFGDLDHYEIQFQNDLGDLVQEVTTEPKISVTGLRPHHTYNFLITVLSGYNSSTVRRSTPVSITATTLESVPGAVPTFGYISLEPNSILLNWTMPLDQANGVITRYQVNYYPKNAREDSHKVFGADVTTGAISDLKAGTTYVFEIQAYTKVGPGGKRRIEVTLPIGAPPLKEPNVSPTALPSTVTDKQIRVRFNKGFFTDRRGPVIAYTLIVQERDGREIPGPGPPPSWNDVQEYQHWPAYQAIEPYYPFNYSSTEEFTIGTEECSGRKRYCNGPLKPGTQYKVKVRAFTAPEHYTDTMYSGYIETDFVVSSVPESQAANPVLIGVLVGLVLVLGSIPVACFYLRHRRRGIKKAIPKPYKSAGDFLHSDTEMTTSQRVLLKDFCAHYARLSKDSDYKFAEEFEALKDVGRDKTTLAADLPVNRPKNRFTNILPYDHSRVKLQPSDDDEGSDYINANYVGGFNSPREYIVTQGPLHSTRDDFWRMVWEQQCRAIVMLTRCIEKGREKCDHYWPYDTEPINYGDIQVTVLNSSQFPNWVVSEFKVVRGDSTRNVRHYHFTTWPDFGVPSPPQVLIKFVRIFREYQGVENKPIVVHCSAGVGRSGTFIALDHILQHIKKYDYVDVLSLVYEMRKQRIGMVQNEQQYICIYQCLLCVLEGNEEIGKQPRPEAHENHGFEDDEGIAESGM